MKLYIILIVLCFSEYSFSYFSNAVVMGSGGAGLAAVEPGAASLINPANLVHILGHQLFFTKATNQYSIGISDSSPDNIMPASLAYVNTSLGDSRKYLADTYVSLADFISARFSIGMGFHFSQRTEFEKNYRQVNLGLGLTYLFSEIFGASLVGFDLANLQNEEMPANYKLSPSFGIGFNYIYKTLLRIRGDLVSQKNMNMTDPQVKLGLESFINKWVVFRIGYLQDNLTQLNRWSYGVGFYGPRFSVHYGYFSGNKLEESIQSVDLAIPF